MWDSSCSRSTQKFNLQQFFLQCWRLQGSNFNGTGLHQGALLEKFKQNNLAKIGFFKSEAVVWRSSVTNVFVKISQNSQENTCASLFFNKIAGLRFSYVPVRHIRSILNRSVLLTYQFSLIKVPPSTSLQHLKDIGLIQLEVATSLRRVMLVSLPQVSIGALLRLKLAGFISHVTGFDQHFMYIYIYIYVYIYIYIHIHIYIYSAVYLFLKLQICKQVRLIHVQDATS